MSNQLRPLKEPTPTSTAPVERTTQSDQYASAILPGSCRKRLTSGRELRRQPRQLWMIPFVGKAAAGDSAATEKRADKTNNERSMNMMETVLETVRGNYNCSTRN